MLYLAKVIFPFIRLAFKINKKIDNIRMNQMNLTAATHFLPYTCYFLFTYLFFFLYQFIFHFKNSFCKLCLFTCESFFYLFV